MTITVKLDVASLNGTRPNDPPRRKISDEDREARLEVWLREKYDEGSWNALVDARPGVGR
jgi:hypothetical protein